MTRSDLTTKLSLRMKVSKKEAEKYLSAFLDSIMNTLEKDGRVVVQGFGSFRLREYAARVAKKPITGEPIQLPARKKPVFHASKELRDKINRDYQAPKPVVAGTEPIRVGIQARFLENVHGKREKTEVVVQD